MDCCLILCLKIIGDINNRIKSMEEQSGQTDNQSHIMLTQEEYDALEEKDPNIVYFIVAFFSRAVNRFCRRSAQLYAWVRM